MTADPTTRPNGESREAVRRAAIAALPAWYSPWAHLAFPAFFGLGLIAVMAAAISHLRPVELLTIPAVWLLSNGVEWRAHKDLLHRRFPFFEVLYDRHTPQHHRIFVESDMAMRSAREFGLVLIPFYGILAIVALDVPFAFLLWHFGQGNIAALFLATSAAYVLSYEWLHLCYHLPEAHPVGRLALVAHLRRHHATHHNPALMQRYNFNVTVPLWDFLHGTTFRGEPEAQSLPQKERARGVGR